MRPSREQASAREEERHDVPQPQAANSGAPDVRSEQRVARIAQPQERTQQRTRGPSWTAPRRSPRKISEDRTSVQEDEKQPEVESCSEPSLLAEGQVGRRPESE